MCTININNEYNNNLFKTGLLDEYSNDIGKDRKRLFYFLCIPIRIFLFFVLLYLSQNENKNFQTVFRIVLAIIYFTSIIYLSLKQSKCQWWNNSFEIILCIVAFSICILVPENTTMYVSFIFLISILSGLSQSIYLKPFES